MAQAGARGSEKDEKSTISKWGACNADTDKRMFEEKPSPETIAECEYIGSADRRESARQAASFDAKLSKDSDPMDKGKQVMVIDMSLSGVGFHSVYELEKGTVYWMSIQSACLRANGRVKILNCRPRAEGGYDYGAIFC